MTSDSAEVSPPRSPEKEASLPHSGNSDVPEAKETTLKQTAILNPDEQAIPLGGQRAWLQVLGGFLAFLNIWSVDPNILCALTYDLGASPSRTAYFRRSTS